MNVKRKICIAAHAALAVFWAWVIASWLDVIGQNMTPGNTAAAWNIFKIVF